MISHDFFVEFPIVQSGLDSTTHRERFKIANVGINKRYIRRNVGNCARKFEVLSSRRRGWG